MNRNGLVVGISGPSSSGKTTLALLLRSVFAPSESHDNACFHSDPELKPETKAFIVHEDDFYYPDDRIPVTTTASGKLVEDWDTIDAIDIQQFDTALSYIRQHSSLPPNLKSKVDLNDATDSGVDDATVQKLRREVAQRLQRKLVERSCASFCLVFVDGFLLYAPPDEPAHPLRSVHAQIDLPLFLPVTYTLLKERREGRTGYVTVGPAPTPKLKEGGKPAEGVSEKSERDKKEDTASGDSHQMNFWTDPPGYVDDIVWPRYISNYAWLLVPDSISAAKKEGSELKDIIGEGSEVKNGLDIHVAPKGGEATMESLLYWAVESIFKEIEQTHIR